LDDKRIANLKTLGNSITFGSSLNSDFSAKINIENDGKLTLAVNSIIIPTKSYNLSFLKNCIAVTAIGITLGLNESELKSKIQSFKTPKGRCSIKKVNGVTIIDDSYNANLNSSLAALNYLNAFKGEREKVFIFGDMFELGEKSIEQHTLIGQKCTNLKIDVVLTIGKHTEHTNLALDKSIKSKHYHSPDKIITDLKKIIKPNDVLLFKGSRGMKMENIIKGVFDI
jgi:UDP-N-acetylmuramoyl-tripeptide--D-alanyl-D-alanine ligase